MQWLDYHKGLGVGRVYVIDHLSGVSLTFSQMLTNTWYYRHCVPEERLSRR